MSKIQFDPESVDDPRPVSLIFRIASEFIVFICIISTILQLSAFISDRDTLLWWIILLVNLHGIWIFSHIAVRGIPPIFIRKFFN